MNGLSRIVAKRLDYWMDEHTERLRLARLLSGSPVGGHAEAHATSSRRRRTFWLWLYLAVGAPR